MSVSGDMKSIYGDPYAIHDPAKGLKNAPLPKPEKTTKSGTGGGSGGTGKLSKKEQQAAEERQAQMSYETEVKTFVDNTLQSDQWKNSSWQRKFEYVDNFKNNIYPEYAKTRFGNDMPAANRMLFDMTEPLLANAKESKGAIDTWSNHAQNVADRFAKGLDNFWDQGVAVPVVTDVLSGAKANDPDAMAHLDSLSAAIQKTAENEKARTADNPMRRNNERRIAELKEDNPDWWMLEALADGDLELPLSYFVEQLPNWIPSLIVGGAGAATGAAVGSVTGGAGAAPVVAGTAAALGAVGATQGILQAATELASTLEDMPPEELKEKPRYQELIASGMDHNTAKATLIQQAVKEVMLPVALVSGATNLFGPEAMLARASVIKSWLGKSVTKRALSGLVAGGASEGLEEAGQTIAQNYAEEQALGEDKPLTEGALEAAVLGTIVGGPVSGVASAVGRGDTVTASTGGGTTVTASATDGDTVGGIAKPELVDAPTNLPSTYNQAGTDAVINLTPHIQEIAEETARLVEQEGIPRAPDMEPLFRKIKRVEDAGVSRDRFIGIFSTLQDKVNQDTQTTLNVEDTYDKWLNNQNIVTEADKLKALIAKHPIVPLTQTTPQQTTTQPQTFDLPIVVYPNKAEAKGEAHTLELWESSQNPDNLSEEELRLFNTSITEDIEALKELNELPKSRKKKKGFTEEQLAKQKVALENILSKILFISRRTPASNANGVLSNATDWHTMHLSNAAPNIYSQWQLGHIFGRLRDDNILGPNRKRIQPGEVYGRAGRTGTGTESDSAATTDTAGSDSGIVAASAPGTAGNGGTVESAGVGGTAHADAQPTVGDVRDDQSTGRRDASGADSGRDSGTDAEVGTGTATGKRGHTGPFKQRASDGRYSAVVSELTDASSVGERAAIKEQYYKQRLQYYASMELPGSEAEAAAALDVDTASALVSFIDNLQERPDYGMYPRSKASVRELGVRHLQEQFRKLYDQQIEAGVSPEMARAGAVDYLMQQIAVDTASAADKVKMQVVSEQTEAQNNIQEVQARANTSLMAAAIQEAVEDPELSASPLATLGTMDMVETLPPVVQEAVDGDQPGVLSDVLDPTNIEGAEIPPVQFTEEEIRARQQELGQQINNALTEGVPVQGVEVTLPDGTQTMVVTSNVQPSQSTSPTATPGTQLTPTQLATVKQVAKIMIQVFQGPLTIGQALVRNQRAAFTNYKRAPVWMEGWWARMGTAIRNVFQDGGGDFRLFCLRYLSNDKGDPDHNPVWMAFSALPNRIAGAARVITDNCIRPIGDWFAEQADKLGMRVSDFAMDIGNYRTAMHSIECYHKQAQELNTAFQNAMLLPPGPGRLAAIALAQGNLDAFKLRQDWRPDPARPDPPKICKLQGGRSLWEAETLRDELIAKYGKDLCEESSTQIGKGLHWVTSYLIENGQLGSEEVSGFDNFNYYCPMLTKEQVSKGSFDDIAYFSPKQNYHRYGSLSPALDSFTTFTKYACRTSRTVGMSEFGVLLRQAYLTFKKEKAISRKKGQTVYYNGMAMYKDRAIQALINSDDVHVNVSTRKWAQNIADNTAFVIQNLETDKNGNTSIVRYRVLFDTKDLFFAKVQRSAKTPFNVADPHVALRWAGNINRAYFSIFTRFNPYFLPLNMVRDILERTSLLPGREYTNDKGDVIPGWKIAAQMVAYAAWPMTWSRMIRFWKSGKSGQAYLDTILRDYTASGLSSSSSYNELLAMARKEGADINDHIIPTLEKLYNKNVAKKAGATLTKWTEFMYAYPSMVQFVKMRENGISIRQTVQGVNELMNMQQRGRAHTVLSALYPFVTSISQTAGNLLNNMGLGVTGFANGPGTGRLRRTAKSWATMIGAYMIIRTLIPFMRDSLDDDEEKAELRMDLMPLDLLSQNVIIGTGDGAYVKLPTGFGFFNFGAMLAYGMDRVERGKMQTADLMGSLLFAFAKNMVPNSAPAFSFYEHPVAFVAQTLTPGILSPFAQAATNTAYTGSQLSYENRGGASRRSDRGRFETHQMWQQLARDVYDVFGFDPRPEELRTVANGYMGGLLRGAMSWLEADPFYSNPEFETTRQKLGPFLTAIGATQFYDVGINIPQTAFYDARSYYEGSAKRAGIGDEIKGDADAKIKTLQNVGFTLAEAQDYVLIYKTQNKLNKLAQDLRGEFKMLFGPDMDETAMKRLMRNYASERQQIQEDTIKQLNYFSPHYQRRFDLADEDAAAILRREVPGAPVVPGTLNPYTQPVLENPDGSLSVANCLTGQDKNGLWVNYPTIGPDGEPLSETEAWEQYLTTGQHFGKFRTLSAAEADLRRLPAK